MSIAIMQPYIFPYIGYFQLIYASDTFVFYDDVNFINRGWVNRNRILVNGKDQLFTIPCKDASQNKLIKDIWVVQDPKAIGKILTTIQMAYKKAPLFHEVFPIIQNVLHMERETTLAELAIKSILAVCKYLGLERRFIVSSETYTNQELKKGDRLIDICHIENDLEYINAQGGRELYTKDYFKAKGVNLSFLITEKSSYLQYDLPFVPFLSIIDVLMFNQNTEVLQLLTAYEYQ